MGAQELVLNSPMKQNIELKGEVSSIFLNFDIIMIKILQKFYFHEESFPADTSCYYVQQLFSELKSDGLRINLETLRKRLESLVKLNLMEKVDTYPRIYTPIRDVEKVRDLLTKVRETFL